MQIQRPVARKRLLSLTPLIDVVFILLLFFMLASSFLEWRTVGLSVAAGESTDAPDTPPVVIGIKPEGKFELDGETMALDAVIGEVQSRVVGDAEQRFVLQPQNEVPLQRIVTVLDRMKAVGGSNVILVRE